MKERILTDWIFTDEKKAQSALKRFIGRKIRTKQNELKALKAKL